MMTRSKDKENAREEERSHERIYYLFSFLLGWYGVAWYLFPKILRRVTALEDSGIGFIEDISHLLLIVFIAVSIILLILGFSERKKRRKRKKKKER